MTDIGGVVLELNSFRSREHGAWHFKFLKLRSQRQDLIGDRLALPQLVQAISQCKHGVEREKALGLQNGTNPLGELLPHLLAFRIAHIRTRQQICDFFLGKPGVAASRLQELTERTSSGIKELISGGYAGKRSDHLLP